MFINFNLNCEEQESRFNMIKRLKWNVLYDDDGDDDILDYSSDDSAEAGTAEASEALEILAKNDPELRTALKSLTENASLSDIEDEEDVESKESEEERSDSEEDEKENTEFREWRECDLCPGKHLLNDNDVEVHLKSRRHQKAFARFEREQTQNAGQNGTNDNVKEDSGDEEEGASKKVITKTSNDALTEAEKLQRDQKRKMKAKRKLKALKRRKWEKLQEQKKQEESYKVEREHEGDVDKKSEKILSATKVEPEVSETHPSIDLPKKERKRSKSDDKKKKTKRERPISMESEEFEEDSMNAKNPVEKSKSEEGNLNAVNGNTVKDMDVQSVATAKEERKQKLKAKRQEVREKKKRRRSQGINAK